MADGNYRINAMPIDNKTWNEADKIEVVLTLDTDKEVKSFKGIVDLFGIVVK